jgi:hypothetical protein
VKLPRPLLDLGDEVLRPDLVKRVQSVGDRGAEIAEGVGERGVWPLANNRNVSLLRSRDGTASLQ